MGKGGGGAPPPAQPQNVTTTTSNLPEYAEPFFTRLMQRGEAISQEDYIPIEQQRLKNSARLEVVIRKHWIFNRATLPEPLTREGLPMLV